MYVRLLYINLYCSIDLFDDYDMVDGYFGLHRIFQHAAGGTILSGLTRYLLATAAGVIVPRIIAVGQH